MEGRYTFFVASTLPTSSVTLCAIAVMGTRYLRVQSVVESLEMETGVFSYLTVPHIYSEEEIGNQLAVDLRQQGGAELEFVTFVNGVTSTEVIFDTTDVQIGVYYLVLESYDTSSNVKSTLKTDTVTITVTDTSSNVKSTLKTDTVTIPVTGVAPILAYFTEEL